jgi:GDP-L-fucose synthase
LVFLLEHYSDELIVNVGVGADVTIRELAETVGAVVGFKGKLEFDITKPDGPPRKLLDVSRLTQLGWRAETPLSDGIRATYDWYGRNATQCRL